MLQQAVIFKDFISHVCRELKLAAIGCDVCAGASRDYVDLLPDPDLDQSWTTFLPTVEDIGDDVVFAFDGQTTAVEVPRRVVDPDTLQQTGFTVAVWMKHDGGQEHDGKQQILCAADSQGTCHCH